MTKQIIDGEVRIGYIYRADFDGLRYCAEFLENMHLSSDNIGGLAQQLRLLRVSPFQIANMGTENPFITEPVSEDKLVKLLRLVSKPMICVTKLPRKISIEDGVDLNGSYLIEVGDNSFKRRLSEIPAIFRYLECTENDLILTRKVPDGYAPLNMREKYYILGYLS